MNDYINLFGFLLVLALLYFLICGAKGLGGVRKLTYSNPPMPEIKIKCICNDIDKQSPGSKCEACHSRPEFPPDRIN